MSFGQYSIVSFVRGDSTKRKKKSLQPQGQQGPVYITSEFYSAYRSSRYTAKCVSKKELHILMHINIYISTTITIY